MEVAQAKAQMHETMELKDSELQEVRTTCQGLKTERDELSEQVQQLTASSE